ncbi:MAG: hypothetical protein LBS41_05065 [Streptococcaceae bacterium]|jgi:hypothetical protein|nr:hypothetical protein [Streptococcaceae bacterium]
MVTRHHQQIPADVMYDTQELLDKIDRMMSPYLLTLTAKERQEMTKMGNKSLSFVEKAYDYATKYPHLYPAYLNLADFAIDKADATGLRQIIISVRQLCDDLESTAMLAGSESFQNSLAFYRSSKDAATRNVPGASEVYSDLKERFPGKKKRKAQPAVPDIKK